MTLLYQELSLSVRVLLAFMRKFWDSLKRWYFFDEKFSDGPARAGLTSLSIS